MRRISPAQSTRLRLNSTDVAEVAQGVARSDSSMPYYSRTLTVPGRTAVRTSALRRVAIHFLICRILNAVHCRIHSALQSYVICPFRLPFVYRPTRPAYTDLHIQYGRLRYIQKQLCHRQQCIVHGFDFGDAHQGCCPHKYRCHHRSSRHPPVRPYSLCP